MPKYQMEQKNISNVIPLSSTYYLTRYFRHRSKHTTRVIHELF